LETCPECGGIGRLYRTARGLRCMNCIRRVDSAGIDFRRDTRLALPKKTQRVNPTA